MCIRDRNHCMCSPNYNVCGHPDFFCVNDANSQPGYKCEKYNIDTARRACLSYGSDWKVDKEGSGALICTKGSVSSGNNCNNCDTWRLIVWKDGSPMPFHCADYTDPVSTVAGYYYRALDPCECGDNYGQGHRWDEPCA